MLYECHHIPRNAGGSDRVYRFFIISQAGEDVICGIPSSRRACPFPELKNFLFTNINATCILVTSLILNKDKERKRVNRFSGRELPYGERQ